MPSPSQISALVVEDQASMRTMVVHGLRELGLSAVTEAEDGEDALRALLKAPVHLIISDANMPKMDGLHLLRAVRAHPPIANTGFIMLTGRADKSFVEKCIAHGVNNYLLKPFTTADLRKKVEAVLGPLT